MRYLIISILAISVIGASENPKLDQAVNAYYQAIAAADEARDEAIAEIEARHAAETARATEITVRNLKRLINRRSEVAEQAEIYKTVLFINRADEEAVRFFTAIGTLDAVLAEIDNVNMLIGKVEENKIPMVNIGIGQHIVLNADNVTETTAEITHNNEVGRKIFQGWRSERSATWAIKLQPGAYEFSATYGSEVHDTTIQINIMETDKNVQLNVPFTGSLGNWRTVRIGELNIDKIDGLHVVGTGSNWVMHLDNIIVRRIR